MTETARNPGKRTGATSKPDPIGGRKDGNVRITVIRYDPNHYEEKRVGRIEECFPIKGEPGVTWVNIDGLERKDIIEKVGAHLEVFPLIVEDVLRKGGRPKLEEFDDYIFAILKMLYYGESKKEIVTEQVSCIFGENYVVTFQERIGDVFEPVRQRLKSGKGRGRRMGSDYLAFMLIDAIIDNYFLILEGIGDRMASLEEEVVEFPTKETLRATYKLRRKLLFLDKAIWPSRTVVDRLERSDSRLIKRITRQYLRDVYDHAIQVIESIETYREVFSNMLDIYVSSISNKLNEIMKVLTIIATIFMPLSFIVGVYGMNFTTPFPPYVAEWGFLVIMLLNFGVVLTMLIYFRRRRWL
ncbi:MAG: magnesium/cobalt transporter CorA [Promethearchaeati archaeon SRVP18_Atabeyarchaeia-1]